MRLQHRPPLIGQCPIEQIFSKGERKDPKCENQTLMQDMGGGALVRKSTKRVQYKPWPDWEQTTAAAISPMKGLQVEKPAKWMNDLSDLVTAARGTQTRMMHPKKMAEVGFAAPSCTAGDGEELHGRILLHPSPFHRPGRFVGVMGLLGRGGGEREEGGIARDSRNPLPFGGENPVGQRLTMTLLDVRASMQL